MRRCRDEDRAANPAEQVALARWAGWGSIPQVFDDAAERFAAERAQIRQLLGTEEAWSQARRTTLNAHYTSASVVTAMWSAVRDLGVDGPVRVLEPGCGSGNFLGFAPPDAVLTGVELDPTTATIARHLYAPDMPDPDLMVRTSGEFRISNYLLWEVAYSELVFTDVLWPDFRREHLFDAIREFQGRSRRFGAIDEDGED